MARPIQPQQRAAARYLSGSLLVARRDLKKIQPKGPRRGQKRMRKGAAELIFSWILFVRTEIPCLPGTAQSKKQGARN
jgi:hypothetical protein